MESPLVLGQPTQEELEARRAAERIGAPFLVYRDDEGRQHIFSFAQRARSVTLGRREEADISLPWDPEMSRVHAVLELRAGEWTVTDDGLSRNGTWVNGARIVARTRLRDGDVVQVGQTLLAIRVPDPEDSRPTVAAGGPAAPELTPAQRRVLEALVRPYAESEFATPATNQQIAEELFLSVDAVKAHLRALFTAFGIEELAQNQKRSHLAMRARQLGIVR